MGSDDVGGVVILEVAGLFERLEFLGDPAEVAVAFCALSSLAACACCPHM